MAALVFLAVLFVLFSVGVPISLALGAGSVVIFAVFSNSSLEIVPHTMYNTLNSFPLMAVPFFVLAADLMANGGLGKYLVDLTRVVFGRVRGGMAVVSIIACMIFAAISGSAVATCATIGMLTIPAMVNLNYPPRLAAAVVAASGTLGILIPPSIPMILYGFMAEQSTAKLFLAGAVPGVLIGLVYIIYCSFVLRKLKVESFAEDSGAKKKIIIKGLPALFMPITVLGGIYGGVFTPTEASVFAVVYSLIMSCFVYREVKLSELIPLVGRSMKTSSMIMLIIATSMVFGNILSLLRVPQQLLEFVLSANVQPWMFLIVANIALFIAGMFMEVAAVLLITTPLFLPIVHAMKVDPIHFAVIMVVSMTVGLITPPVGLNLYISAGVAGLPISEVIKGSIPFLIILILIWITVIAVPDLSLWLPSVVLGY